jgi:aspartate-semialdehyde dehydrogenase
MSRIRVAVLGATGVAGQQFLAALPKHPLFDVVRLGASARSAGKPYGEAIRDANGKVSWFPREALDPALAALTVEDVAAMTPDGVDLVFTAVESDAARELEPRFAVKVPVVSTASAFRYERDVPVLLPGVNPSHVQLIDWQRKERGWKGFITPGPNCTTTGLAITLAPLHQAFGVERVVMTSLQSVSGAGRSPGVLAMDIVDNVVPYIAKEEEKVERETKKILGTVDQQGIVDAGFAVSCTCTRVPVLDGHTESVFVGLKQQASLDEVKAAMTAFGKELVALNLPSSPKHLITVSDDPYRPQPRLDRDNEDGMTTTVGRLREDKVLGGVKYVLVSHNTRMGAAKGAILTAEYLALKGYI